MKLNSSDAKANFDMELTFEQFELHYDAKKEAAMQLTQMALLTLPSALHLSKAIARLVLTPTAGQLMVRLFMLVGRWVLIKKLIQQILLTGGEW